VGITSDVVSLMRYPNEPMREGVMPYGKGMYIYILERLGSPEQVVDKLQEAGYQWAAIKLQSGRLISEGIKSEGIYLPLAEKYVNAFEHSGIDLFGWGYVMLNSDTQVVHEIATTVDAIKRFDVKGWIINAEAEAKNNQKRASRYLTNLRTFIGDYPIGFTSYRWPESHPEFPWKEFFTGCDYAQPQVYWVGAHNPEAQLKKCIEQYEKYGDMPIQPIGCAYPDHEWRPTITDLDVFYNAVKKYGLLAWSWWEMYYAMVFQWWDTLALHGEIEEPEEEPNMWTNNARGVYIRAEDIELPNLSNYDFVFADPSIHFTDDVQAAYEAKKPILLFFQNDPELYRDMNLGSWPEPDDDPQIKVIDSMLRMQSGAMRKVHGIVLNCSKVRMSDGDNLTDVWIAEHGKHMVEIIWKRYHLPVWMYMDGNPLRAWPNSQSIINWIEGIGVSVVSIVQEKDGYPADGTKPTLPYHGSKGWGFWLYSVDNDWKWLYNGDVKTLYEMLAFEAEEQEEPEEPEEPGEEPTEEPSDTVGLSKFEKMVIARLDRIINLL